MGGIKILVFLTLILFVLTPSLDAEHSGDKYFSVYDTKENYIFSTAMQLTVGDEYINEENNRYRVIEIDGTKGIAKFLEQVDLLESKENDIEIKAGPVIEVGLLGSPNTLGLYHTHTGESYLPGEAIEEGYGDIYKVGEELAEDLENLGINVLHSWANHLPHDGGAYDRSRPTALNLLEEGADSIIDVHRDAVPRREEYITELDGETVSQIRLVVGRQNPTMQVNDTFARRIKAEADERYPGLIKGIFYASGKYNQDLSPYAMLLEFGTHVSPKEEALASTEPMAEVLGATVFSDDLGGEAGLAAWANILLIIGAIVLGLLVYFYVQERNWEAVWVRIMGLIRHPGREKD